MKFCEKKQGCDKSIKTQRNTQRRANDGGKQGVLSQKTQQKEMGVKC